MKHEGHKGKRYTVAYLLLKAQYGMLEGPSSQWQEQEHLSDVKYTSGHLMLRPKLFMNCDQRLVDANVKRMYMHSG